MKTLLCGSTLLPNIIFFNKLIERDPESIGGILISSRICPSNTLVTLKYCINMLSNSGLDYSTYMTNLWFKGTLKRLIHKQNMLTVSELSKKYDIPLIYAKNFSDAKLHKKINAMGVDRLLAYYCDQIFSSETINNLNMELYNLHPSILPNHRGIDPIFQQLYSCETRFGVTLHSITEKIDQGPILQSIEFNGEFKSHSELLLQSTNHAIDLAENFLHNKNIFRYSQDNKHISKKYRSWPTRDEIREFKESYGRLC